jgi:hypothetical protein
MFLQHITFLFSAAENRQVGHLALSKPWTRQTFGDWIFVWVARELSNWVDLDLSQVNLLRWKGQREGLGQWFLGFWSSLTNAISKMILETSIRLSTFFFQIRSWKSTKVLPIIIVTCVCMLGVRGTFNNNQEPSIKSKTSMKNLICCPFFSFYFTKEWWKLAFDN